MLRYDQPVIDHRADTIVDIRANVVTLGVALYRDAESAAVLERFDARVAELRAKVAEVGFDTKPVGVVRVRDNDYSIRVGTTESKLPLAAGD